MNELRLKYPVRMMRRIMNVSASGYYAWVDRPLSKRAQEEVRLELEIMAAHQRNRQTYGPERLQRDLAEHGVRVGVCRIKRIRQKLGIRCKQKRRFKTTTNSAHRLPVADNLLGQQFKVSQPNAVWVSDITYPELPISSCLGPSNAPSSTRAIVVSLTDAVNHPIKLTKPSLGVVS